MSSWGEILNEFQIRGNNGLPDSDGIRRKYLAQLSVHTGRPTIVYATNFTQPLPPGAEAVHSITINDEDLQGIMEVVRGLQGPALDLVLHSPGGSIEAAEAIVSYLRTKFSDIRVIVPQLALSAACMIACSANRIVMGKHSFLGPIDPQLILQTPLGVRMVPAQIVLEQFAKARDECKTPSNLAAWAPMLAQFGPELIVRCEHVSALSRHLVEQWLKRYMFAGRDDVAELLSGIPTWLADHTVHKTHQRHIPRDALRTQGLVIDFLEDDQVFQDLTLSVYHAVTHTFTHTGCLKIIENQLGRAFLKLGPGALRAATPQPSGAFPSGQAPSPGKKPFLQRLRLALNVLFGRV
jgi:hypothetical protein